MLKRIADFAEKVFDPRPGLIFQATNKCNSKCLMCFKWQELNKSLGKELSISDIEHITKQLPNLSSVVIGGGEPFLRDDLPDICRLFEPLCQRESRGL